MSRTCTALLFLIATLGCGRREAPRVASTSLDVDAAPSYAGGPEVALEGGPDVSLEGGRDSTPRLAFHPDDDPACADLREMTRGIKTWHVAMNPARPRETARTLWTAMARACRGGAWYLAAAEFVGQSDDAALTSADGTVVIHSATDALSRGLAAEPDHPELLAHLAFADDLTPGRMPPPPADACARARARADGGGDGAAYVCALAALHAGEAATTLVELDHIQDPRAHPDLQVRRAQALAAAGRRKDAAALARPAADALRAAWGFELTQAARDALLAKLQAATR